MTTLEFGVDPNVVALLRGVAHPNGHLPELARGFEDVIGAIDQESAGDQGAMPAEMREAMREPSVSRRDPMISYSLVGLPVNKGRLVAFIIEAMRYPDIPPQKVVVARPRLMVGRHLQNELRPFPGEYEWGEFALGLVPKNIARASGIVVSTLDGRRRR